MYQCEITRPKTTNSVQCVKAGCLWRQLAVHSVFINNENAIIIMAVESGSLMGWYVPIQQSVIDGY